MRLFLRLTTEVNDRLRTMMRYHGELSRYIDKALTAADLEVVDLLSGDSDRGRDITVSFSTARTTAYAQPPRNVAAPSPRSPTALSRNGSEISVKRRGNVTARARTMGLVSSFIAAAAIGLTLLVDHEHGAFSERDSRSERIFLSILVDSRGCELHRSLPVAIGVSLAEQCGKRDVPR